MTAASSANPKPSSSEAAFERFWNRLEPLLPDNLPVERWMEIRWAVLDTALRVAGLAPVPAAVPIVMPPLASWDVVANQRQVDQLLAHITRASSPKEINLFGGPGR